MLRTWCDIQIGPWRRAGLDRAAAYEEYKYHSGEREDFFIFRIDGGEVHLEKKTKISPSEEVANWLLSRSKIYTDLLRSVLRVSPLPEGMIIPIVCGDFSFSSETAPAFCFQKPATSIGSLLPDVDFIHLDYYESEQFKDPIPYADKKTAAVFVGSTTGDGHTVESIQQLSNERISAGVAFRDHPKVDFRLPAVLQCTSPEAEALLRQMGFGDGVHVPWHEQFKNKFVISIDGNGATCSRVAIALKSNCVLMKYNSDSVLYYFSSMLPWVHYVPIRNHSDVTRIIEIEEHEPGVFQEIAGNGREFYDRYLQRDCVDRYAWTLLSEFNRCFV